MILPNPATPVFRKLLLFKCLSELEIDMTPDEVCEHMQQNNNKRRIDILHFIFDNNLVAFRAAVKLHWRDWKKEKNEEATMDFVNNFSFDTPLPPLKDVLSPILCGASRWESLIQLLRQGISHELICLLEQLGDVHAETQGNSKKKWKEMHSLLEEIHTCSRANAKRSHPDDGRCMMHRNRSRFRNITQ